MHIPSWNKNSAGWTGGVLDCATLGPIIMYFRAVIISHIIPIINVIRMKMRLKVENDL